MLANILIAMALIGLLAGFGDLLLNSGQKKSINHFVEIAWYKLASIKAGPIITRARSRWLFAVAIFAPAIFLIVEDFSLGTDRILADMLLMAPAIVCGAPLVWWMSRSNSFLDLAIRAAVSAVLLSLITIGIMWLGARWFIEDADDEVIWKIFIGQALLVLTIFFFAACVVLPLLPVPLAYLGVKVLQMLEFLFRRCIESNRGAFLSLCGFVGGLATLYKLFA